MLTTSYRHSGFSSASTATLYRVPSSRYSSLTSGYSPLAPPPSECRCYSQHRYEIDQVCSRENDQTSTQAFSKALQRNAPGTQQSLHGAR